MHYEWSLLLPAPPGREEQAGDCDMSCGGAERRDKQEDKGGRRNGENQVNDERFYQTFSACWSVLASSTGSDRFSPEVD